MTENRRQASDCSEESWESSTRPQEQTNRVSYQPRDPPDNLRRMREESTRFGFGLEFRESTSAYDQGLNDRPGSRGQQTFSEPMETGDLPQPEISKPKLKRTPHSKPLERTMQDYTLHQDETGRMVPIIEDLIGSSSQDPVATYGHGKDDDEAQQALEDAPHHDTQLLKPFFYASCL